MTSQSAVDFYYIVKDPHDLNNLAKDPSYDKMIPAYTSTLRKWSKEQGNEGASGNRVYNQ